MTRCPHSMIQFCPLYVAAHGARLAHFGCISGNWEEGCEVERGETVYTAAVAKLAKVWPGMVQGCADRESAELSRQQRNRNMRAAGVH